MRSVTRILLGTALGWLAGGVAQGAALPPADLLGLAGTRVELPLGRPGLPQHVTLQRLAPGVSYYRVQRGAVARTASWYLLGDVLRTGESPDKLKDCFARLGVEARISEASIAGAAEHPYRTVSGGSYASRTAAVNAAQAAPACRLYPRHSSEDAGNASGPWSIHVVAIAPRASSGRWLAAANESGPVLRTRTSELARAHRALFAINGGFFVEQPVDGVPGEAAGISLLSGRVNGAPVAQRPALVLRDDPARPVAIVKNVGWQAYLAWADGKRTLLDGVNRRQGLVRNCGRDEHDRAIHDHTCSYPDDLVYYPPGSAVARAVRGDIQFAIDPAGNVRKLGADEALPASDALLAGSQDGSRNADIEQQIARQVGASFQLESSLPGDAGKRASVVNGGPTLLLHGDYVRQDAQEGWAIDAIDDPAHTLLMHDWITRRNPRTAVGVRADGTVLLLVVDGHRHGTSVGMTIEELRQVMGKLGAKDAINLDGGGSSAMVLRERLVNSPSDLDGERKIGDAVLFIEDKQAKGAR
jgi:hypothetical protein